MSIQLTQQQLAKIPDRECPMCGKSARPYGTFDMIFGWHYRCATLDGPERCGYTFWWGLMQVKP